MMSSEDEEDNSHIVNRSEWQKFCCCQKQICNRNRWEQPGVEHDPATATYISFEKAIKKKDRIRKTRCCVFFNSRDQHGSVGQPAAPSVCRSVRLSMCMHMQIRVNVHAHADPCELCSCVQIHVNVHACRSMSMYMRADRCQSACV